MPPNTPNSHPTPASLEAPILIETIDQMMVDVLPLDTDAIYLKRKSYRIGDNRLLSIVYLGAENPIKTVIVEEHGEFEPEPPGVHIASDKLKRHADGTPVYWWTIEQSFYFPKERGVFKSVYQEPETMVDGFHGALDRLIDGDIFFAQATKSMIENAYIYARGCQYDESELQKHLVNFGITEREVS